MYALVANITSEGSLQTSNGSSSPAASIHGDADFDSAIAESQKEADGQGFDWFVREGTMAPESAG